MRHSHHPSSRSEGLSADKRSDFFLTASHQLKAPVAIIQWCLQSLVEDTKLDAHSKNMVQKALTQAGAMSSLISDMLHVFRINNRTGEEILEPVYLNRVINQAFDQCEPIAQREGVKLLLGKIENLPTILAEENYMKQVIINLLDNGIKYSEKGGKVTLEAETHKGWIEISVIDHGIGIPEAEQGRMFTEFFRGEEAKATRHDGTGLGLVLVKKIVETFGGSIHFTSQYHKGSTFTIKFPHGGD